MSSKATRSKAREYPNISSAASNEDFGVLFPTTTESETVDMPAKIAFEVMGRTINVEPVLLHCSGETPRHGNSAIPAASKPSPSQKKRNDEVKRPTTSLRMRAENAPPTPRRRINRSDNKQEDGTKTRASSKKPSTSTATPLYKELKKNDYYWF